MLLPDLYLLLCHLTVLNPQHTCFIMLLFRLLLYILIIIILLTYFFISLCQSKVNFSVLQVNCDEDFKKRVLKCQSLLEKVKLFVDDNGNDGISKIKTEKLSQRFVVFTLLILFIVIFHPIFISNHCFFIIFC